MKPLMTCSEFAQWSGISEESVRRAIEAGMPTCRVQTRGHILIVRAEAMRWFASGGAPAPSNPDPARSTA